MLSFFNIPREKEDPTAPRRELPLTSQEFRYIGDLRDGQDRLVQSILCHCSGVSATLLGILSVFQGQSSTGAARLLTLVGATLLLLSLLSGILAIGALYRAGEKRIRAVTRSIAGAPGPARGSESASRILAPAAETCVFALAAGILPLFVSLFLQRPAYPVGLMVT